MWSRRSRGGCQPCRRSHRKCGEQQPQCERCVSRSLECTYVPIAYSPLMPQRQQIHRPPILAPRPIRPTATMPPADALLSNMTEYSSDYSHGGRQHSQSLGDYDMATMYNAPQSTALLPVYDARQFGSQSSADLQMTTLDVSSASAGVADNVVPHNLQSAAAADVSGSSSIYHQNPSMGYTSSGVTPSAQQLGADVSTNEKEDQSVADLDEKWEVFQRQISGVNQNISTGSLKKASGILLPVSAWLLDHVAELGLTEDDSSLHDDRMKLWKNFNHAWLALGQKQVDLWNSDQQQSTSQHLMSQDTIEKLGNEIVRLCDGLADHGLVDYEYGVWEQRILEVLEKCLDLYEGDGRNAGRFSQPCYLKRK